MWWRIFWGSNSADVIRAGSRDVAGEVYSPGVFATGYLGTRVLARGGNDYVRDVGEEDTVWGGAGNDRIYCIRWSSSGEARGRAPEVYGGQGNDTLHSDGDGYFFGGSGSDRLTCGGDGHSGSAMYGGDGNDRLSISGSGNSHLHGGRGSDVFEINPSRSLPGQYENFTLTVRVDFKPGVDALCINGILISEGTLNQWVESGEISGVHQTREGVSAVFENNGAEAPFQIVFLKLTVDDFMLL